MEQANTPAQAAAVSKEPAAASPTTLVVAKLRLRHEQYICSMRWRWGLVQLLLGMALFYDGACDTGGALRSLLDAAVRRLRADDEPVLGLVTLRPLALWAQCIVSSGDVLQALAGSLLCVNAAALLTAALAHYLANARPAPRPATAVTGGRAPSADRSGHAPPTPPAGRALDWLFFVKRRSPQRHQVAVAPAAQQQQQSAVLGQTAIGRAATAFGPPLSAASAIAPPQQRSFYAGAGTSQLCTPPSTFRPAATSSPYAHRDQQQYATPPMQQQQQHYQSAVLDGSAYSPGQSTPSLQLSTSMLRAVPAAAPSPPSHSAAGLGLGGSFAATSPPAPQRIPVVVSARGDGQLPHHPQHYNSYYEQSAAASFISDAPAAGASYLTDYGAGPVYTEGRDKYASVPQKNVDFETAVGHIAREELAERLAPRHHVHTGAQLDDYLRRYGRDDGRLTAAAGGGDTASLVDVWNVSTGLLGPSRIGAMSQTPMGDGRHAWGTAHGYTTGAMATLAQSAESAEAHRKSEAARARVYAMVSESLRRPASIDDTGGGDADMPADDDADKENVKEAGSVAASLRQHHRRRSSVESIGSHHHHGARRHSPAAGKRETAPALPVPVTDQVYRRYDIDADRLDEITLRLRQWLSATVLKRLVARIDTVNAGLAKAGRPDLLIGHASLATLQQAAWTRGASGTTWVGLCQLVPYLSLPGAPQCYLVRRARDLASDTCMRQFRHDGGGAEPIADGSALVRPWAEHLPTDAELVWHALCCYMDDALPADARSPTADGRLRPFAYKYALAPPHPPTEAQRWPHSFYVCKAQCKPRTHFLLATNGGQEVLDPLQSEHNVWHALALFVAHAARHNDGNIDGVPLDGRGLNLMWIFEGSG